MPCITKCEPVDSESSGNDSKSNDKSNTESKRPDDRRSTSQPYPDIRLPLELKMALNASSDKPSLRATCDISVGHVWGPYRTAGIFRNISPVGESNSAMVYREITILTRNSCDLIVRVNEENAWIKLLQEPTFSDACNVEIDVDASMETITVVALSNISSGSQIRGIVKLVHSNSIGTTKSGSPSPPVISIGFSSTPGPNSTSIGGPKRDKKCLYCGIFFSSVDTLTAHMTNYCSRRPQLTSSGNTIGGNASGTVANSADKSSTSTTDSSDSGVGKNSTTPNPAFPWPSRTTPGKRLNGNASSSTPQSPHSTSRMGHGGVAAGTSPTGLHRALHPPNEMAGVFNAGDPFLNFASTLASLARLRPQLPPTDIPHLTLGTLHPQINHSKPLEEKSPRTPFCHGCQRFYSSSIYQFHVNISQKLKKLADEGNTDVTHLAETSKRLGLVMTAPIITDAGFVYVPVHPDCNGGTVPASGQIGESGSRAPLDLRTGRSSVSEETEKENTFQQGANSVPIAATNNLLASLFSGLVGGGLTTPVPQPPPPANWWLSGGKLPDAATLEALLQAVTASSLQPHQLNTSSSGGEMGRSSTEGQLTSVEVQRPYLCNNCQTRFQAHSTFKAHQQYYCQGRRKIGGSIASENTVAGYQDNTASSTPQSTKSSTCSEQSRSPKRRRIEDVVAEACQTSLKATNTTRPPTSPQSQGGDSSETSPSVRSINGEWEHVGGSSELRCRLCGYIGQTPRGMKMHNRLHDGSSASNANSRSKQSNSSSPNSPSSSSIMETNSSPPQTYPTQQLC
ncbi:unnamed protein product [Rodentolepis nana]|uniref:C2H2-type domain-containing protein n=1 Tax=Rodentolepis nana TaxID=102285 RepID=A0A0R3TKM7_RODNA|nr:unnamed protein product [Rodentolepis nana]